MTVNTKSSHLDNYVKVTVVYIYVSSSNKPLAKYSYEQILFNMVMHAIIFSAMS